MFDDFTLRSKLRVEVAEIPMYFDHVIINKEGVKLKIKSFKEDLIYNTQLKPR
jgi:hypothetical protein